MDYSRINESVREDVAERVAMVVLELENLAHEVPAVPSPLAVQDILKVRKELVQLVKDLGGSPALGS